MSGRPDYAERRAARIERLEKRANRLAAESDSRHAAVRRIADNIPLGQPILVGHHSERRHRRDAQRIHDGMRKAIQLDKQAEETARRADAARENEAISSDDPDALVLLREKLARLEAERARWNAIAKAVRKGPAALAALGLTADEQSTIRITEGAFGFKAKNLGGVIRATKQRIAALTVAASRETPAAETIGSVVISESLNRVQMHFPGKPSDEIRSQLKSNGFRWAPTEKAWQRKASSWAWVCARQIAEQAKESA